jgi:hypothetical protein
VAQTQRRRQAPPFVQLFIESDDLEVTAKKAQELGARVIVPPTALPKGDWMAVLADPTGLARFRPGLRRRSGVDFAISQWVVGVRAPPEQGGVEVRSYVGLRREYLEFRYRMRHV